MLIYTYGFRERKDNNSNIFQNEMGKNNYFIGLTTTAYARTTTRELPMTVYSAKL